MTNERIEVPNPGFFIREEIEARGWSQRDLAFVLGVPEQAVNMIISGKRGITAPTAKALGDAFDVPAEFFLNLQRHFDLSKADEPDPAVARKARLQSVYPLREMIKRGWITDGDTDVLEAHVSRFFEVDEIGDVPRLAHAGKKTDDEAATPTQLAWLFRARQIAREVHVPKFSTKALRAALDELHRLTAAPEEARHVPRILAECGVRYVVVEPLPGGKIDGVCTWLEDGRSPVIGMSLRFDRIDNFWFVLRHEIEHVLRGHGREQAMIDAELDSDTSTDGPIPEEEQLANTAASDFCVSTVEMESFIKRKAPYFSERDLVGFANRLQVHPGLVAGQLRRKTKRWELFTKYLAKIRHIVLPSAIADGWGHTAPVSL